MYRASTICDTVGAEQRWEKWKQSQTSQRLTSLHWPFFDLHLWSDWSPPLTDFGKLNVPFPEVSDPTSSQLCGSYELKQHCCPSCCILTDFVSTQNHFLHCLWPIHNCFVFQTDKYSVKPLPYSKQAICKRSNGKMLHYFSCIFWHLTEKANKISK